MVHTGCLNICYIYFLIKSLSVFFQVDTVSSLIFDQLKRVCIALRMSKPPDNISLDKFFIGIQNKVLSVRSVSNKVVLL